MNIRVTYHDNRAGLTADRLHQVPNNVYRLRLDEQRSRRGSRRSSAPTMFRQGRARLVPSPLVLAVAVTIIIALTDRLMTVFALQHRVTGLPPSRPVFKRLRGIRKWKSPSYRSIHPHSRNMHVIISRSPILLQTDAKRIGPHLPLGRSYNGRAQTFGRQELSVFPRSNQVTHSLLDMAVSSVYNGPSLLSETLSEHRRTAVPRPGVVTHMCGKVRAPWDVTRNRGVCNCI